MLNPNVTLSNARLLHANPGASLISLPTGELVQLSKWNLCGRLLRWLRNFKGAEDLKVNQAVYETLIKVKALMDVGVHNFPTLQGIPVGYTTLAATIRVQKRFAKISAIDEMSQMIIENRPIGVGKMSAIAYTGPGIIRSIAAENLCVK